MSSTPPPGHSASVHSLDDHRAARDAEIPGEVWVEVLAAARLFGLLREAGLSVRFEPTQDFTRMRIRITDLEGNTLKEISPSTAVDPAALAREALELGGPATPPAA